MPAHRRPTAPRPDSSPAEAHGREAAAPCVPQTARASAAGIPQPDAGSGGPSRSGLQKRRVSCDPACLFLVPSSELHIAGLNFLAHRTELPWEKVDEEGTSFTINDRANGQKVYDASRNDLLFGSNQQLRAVAEVYAGGDGQERFVRDFVAVWDKVMMADRYDVKPG